MNKEEFKQKVFSLSERLYPMVSRILSNQANTEDAIQEIMMKLWLKRKKLQLHPNISGFVFLTARNYCFDLLKKRRLKTNEYSEDLIVFDLANSQKQLEWMELNNIIREQLKKLPQQQSTILTMRDIDGFEFNEIAAVTNLKVPHIRVLLSRARKQIKVGIEKTYSHEGS